MPLQKKNENDSTPIKKKGRPRLNPDEVADTTDATTKKRGRPKKKYISRYNDDQPLVPTRITKVDGYCPNCHTALCSFDKVVNSDDKTNIELYVCYKCNKQMSQSELLIEKPNKSEEKYKYKTKREYLEDCLQLSEDHHAPMSTPVIAREDLNGLNIVESE